MIFMLSMSSACLCCGLVSCCKQELDNHTRQGKTGFCTGRLTVARHLLLSKSQAALRFPEPHLSKTNTVTKATSTTKKMYSFLHVVCNTQCSHHRYRGREGLNPSSHLPSLHFPLICQARACGHCRALWAALKAVTNCSSWKRTDANSQPYFFSSLLLSLNCRVCQRKMLSLVHWSSVRHRPQTLGASLQCLLQIFSGTHAKQVAF